MYTQVSERQTNMLPLPNKDMADAKRRCLRAHLN
jgi:hypothetical protein